MIEPDKELFKWGPIEGRPIYVDPFVRAFVEYPEFSDATWPDTIGFCRDDFVTFIMDYDELREKGRHLFMKHVLDDAELDKSYKAWIDVTKKLKTFESLVNKGISKLSDKDLVKQLSAWDRAHIDFWLHGFLPELSNWGGEAVLKKRILEFDRINFIEIFEKLCAPEGLSFFQKEELEFMKIRLMKGAEQEKALKEHQKKYYWLRNNYGFTKVLDLEWFRNELGKISEREAKDKIKDIEGYPERVKKEKNDAIKKCKISSDIIKIADRLAYCVVWQDYRKSFIFIANHIITCFVEEISRRKRIDFKELCYHMLYELEDVIKEDKRFDAKRRFDGFVEYYKERDGTEIMAGKEARDFIRPYIEVHIDPDMREIKGMVVSSGKTVKGKARILLTPRNIDKMKKGEILVAPMTSPDYIIAMRKSAAIVTDEGGMTSHAAIVSRELHVPCIVQTRIATKWLKDGEYIEVDTKKGVVRKVSG